MDRAGGLAGRALTRRVELASVGRRRDYPPSTCCPMGDHGVSRRPAGAVSTIRFTECPSISGGASVVRYTWKYSATLRPQIALGASMEGEDLVPVLETNLSRQLHWISSADAKVRFAFTFATAMLGVLAAVAPSSLETWSTTSAALTLIAGVLEVVALLFASFAAFPRTTGPAGSLIYCGGIVELTREEFQGALRNMSNASYAADLASQCHRNAEIAVTKFRWVHRALRCLYFSVLPWVMALWVLYAR